MISPGSTRKTKTWLARHRRDAHVREAQAKGWRSRAAAKLIAVDDKHKFLHKAKGVLDLGAAPGGWCQVARKRVNADTAVVGVDLLTIEPLPGVSLIEGDFTDPAVRGRIKDLLPKSSSLVLSDAAPSLSGIRDRDNAECEKLHAAVFAAADELDASMVVVKTFSGAPFDFARSLARERFDTVSVQRTPASRKSSSECYVIAKSGHG